VPCGWGWGAPVRGASSPPWISDSAAKGVEPLRTLAGYRTQAGAVMFGMNATHAAPGVIRVGDAVRVVEGAA